MSQSASILPYLGSRVSLISKSDIRYEGLLYSVNPSECTVALSNGTFSCSLHCFVFSRIQSKTFSVAIPWTRVFFFLVFL
jgi:hypothetical protein